MEMWGTQWGRCIIHCAQLRQFSTLHKESGLLGGVIVRRFLQDQSTETIVEADMGAWLS